MFCIVCGYSRAKAVLNNERISIHKFPLPGRGPHKQWLEFALLPPDMGLDVSPLALCSRHFKPEDIIYRNNKGRVCHGGVPSLLPPSSPPNITGLRPQQEHSKKTQVMKDNTEQELSETCGSNEELPYFRSFENNCDEILYDDTSSHTINDIENADTTQCLSATVSKDATVAARKIEDLGEPEHKEVVDKKIVFELMQRLCRICGKKGTCLVPIIGTSSEDNISLLEKIQTYLPLQLSVDNTLPLKICSHCHSLLESWHKLFVTCVATEAAFNSLLNKGEEEAMSTKQEEQGQELEYWNKNDELRKTSDSTDHKYCLPPIEEDCKTSFIEDFKGTLCVRKINTTNYNSCPWCSEKFQYLDKLREHKAKCRELPGLCEHCGFTASKLQVRRHYCQFRPRVEAAMPYVCDKCGKSFGNERNMRRHSKNVHSDKKSICDECNKEFTTGTQLLEHTLTHGREPEFYCHVCYGIFANHTHLLKHRKNHVEPSSENLEEREGEKNDALTCKVCSLLFPTFLCLVVHLNTPKECECVQCFKKVRNERLLLKHRNNCFSRVCKFCSRCFSTAEVCRSHELGHIGFMPYQCETCGKAFSSKHYLAQHRRALHSSILHSCQECGEKFKWLKTLQRHRKRQCQPVVRIQGVGKKCTVKKKQNNVPSLLPNIIS